MRNLAIVIPVLFSSLPALAAPVLRDTASARGARQLGIEIGSLGDPLPQPFGVALGYNLFDFLRLQAQYGVGYASSLGTGHSLSLGSVLMVPGWDLTPAVGLHWAAAFGPYNEWYSTTFGKPGDRLFLTVGLDWQLRSGTSFGVGFNVPLQGDHKLGLPYARVGFYF